MKRLFSIMVMAGALVAVAGADVTNVQIRAASDLDYGIDAVATMVSDVITAPDGLATYQVAFDVTPPAGRSRWNCTISKRIGPRKRICPPSIPRWFKSCPKKSMPGKQRCQPNRGRTV